MQLMSSLEHLSAISYEDATKLARQKTHISLTAVFDLTIGFSFRFKEGNTHKQTQSVTAHGRGGARDRKGLLIFTRFFP